MATLADVAGFIHGQMTANAVSSTQAKIKGYNGSALDFPKALETWRAWVGNRKPWDFKVHIKTTYGEWASDDSSKRDYNFDIWSNLHYGFVGRACEFSTLTLKSGAGYAQWKAGTSPKGYWARRLKKIGDADVLAALDDPLDQAAIEIGTALWDVHGSAVTLKQLIAASRAAAPGLNTKPRGGSQIK